MQSDFASHLKGVNNFLAMEISQRATQLKKSGKDIIHLEFGEPDFPTPEIISQSAIESIHTNKTRYTNTQGVEEFRIAVKDKYKRKYGVSIKENQVLTSSGSSVLLFMAIRLLVPPNDEILITDPGYSCYRNLALIAGVKPVPIKLRLEDGFQLDIDEVKKKITKKNKSNYHQFPHESNWGCII